METQKKILLEETLEDLEAEDFQIQVAPVSVRIPGTLPSNPKE